MNRAIARQRAYLKDENKRFGVSLEFVPGPYAFQPGAEVLKVWRSRDFLVQLLQEQRSKQLRLSVNRTMLDERGEWVAGITWDELQRIKSECLGPEVIAAEIYPPDAEVVDIANIRHLFLLPPDTAIGWRIRVEGAIDKRSNG